MKKIILFTWLLVMFTLVTGIHNLFSQGCNFNMPLQNLSEDFNTPPDPNDISVLPPCWSSVIDPAWASSIPVRVDPTQQALYMFTRADSEVFTPVFENAQGILSLRARKLSNTEDNSTLAIEAVRGNGTRVRVGSLPVNSRNYVSRTFDLSSVAGAPNEPIVFVLSFDNASNIIANVFIDDFEYESFCAPSSPPTAIAKDIALTLDADGIATLNPNSLNDGSIDACGKPVTIFAANKTTFSCDDLGENTVTLTVTDSEGQTNFATATVTVEPGFNFTNSRQVFLDENGIANPDLDFFTASKTDCSQVSYTLTSTGNYTCSEIDRNTVIVTATYPGGSKEFTQLIVVTDNLAPSVITQNVSLNIDDMTGEAVLTPEMIENGSSDNCSIASFSLSKTTFTCADQGDNEVILTVTDGSGNSATGAAVVSVASFIPEVNVTSDAGSLCFSRDGETSSATVSIDSSLPGARYMLRDDANNTVIDGPVTGTGGSLTFTTNTVSETTTYHIYADFLDNGGNIICARIMADKITIGDKTDPSVMVQDITVTIPASGYVTITPDMIDNGSTDDCSEIASLQYSIDQSSFDCDDVGENTVTLTVTDESGNSGSATATVTVNSSVADQMVSVATDELCTAGEETTVSIASSETGVNYFLRNSADHTVIEGPLAGTGDQLDFMTGPLNETTTFNVAGTPEIENKGISFVNRGSYVSAPDIADFDYSRSYTFEAWVFITSTSDHQPIFAIDNPGGVSDVLIYFQKSTSDLVIMHDRGESTYGALFLANDPPESEWFHLAITYDRTNIRAYYNGVLQNNVVRSDGSPTGPKAKTNGLEMKIGRSENTIFGNSGANFTGGLDEVRLWSYARSVAELQADQNNCLEGTEEGLVFNYKLDDEGTEIRDNTGVYNATLIPSNGSTESITGADLTCLACEFQMSTEVTVNVGDTEAPTVMTRDLTVILDENNMASITAEDIDNGSEDNCTATENLTKSLDITSFNETNVGVNVVTLSVTDESGNTSMATAEVTVSEKDIQTITYTGIADKTFGDPEFIITGTSNSGLPIVFSVESGNLTVNQSASGAYVFNITGTGLATVRASNDGDATFAPLNETFTIDIAKADQVVTISTISDQVLTADPFTVAATVNSGLALTYAITSGPATISGNTITLNGTLGSVVVEISQAGGDNYNPVSETISFEVIDRAMQSISFSELADVIYGNADIVLSATSSSSLPVTITLISGPATLNADMLSITGAGTIVLEAKQEGDQNFLPAMPVRRSLTVNKAPLEITANDQTITFGNAVPALTYTITGFVNGEGEQDLNVNITANINAANTTQPDAGEYEITLSIGNSGASTDNYEIATNHGLLTVLKADQTITLTPVEDKLVDTPAFDIEATTDSDLTLTYAVTGPATVNGNTITLDGTPGTVMLTVTQEGNNNFNSASVTDEFKVMTITSTNGPSAAELTLYPNPVKDLLYLSGAEKYEFYKIVSLDGKVHMEAPVKQNTVDTSNLTPGVYLLELYQEQRRTNKRFIKY